MYKGTKWAILTGLVISMMLSAAWAQEFRIGTARRDITPGEPIRLAGYASRNKPSEGIAERIFARALAIQDSTGAKNLLVTVELVGVTHSFTEGIAARLKSELGIERARFMLTVSHTHNGPMLSGNLDEQLDLTSAEKEVIRRHTEKMAALIYEASAEALGKLESARLSFGHGKAGFAVNRRIFTPAGVAFGANYDAATDHDVPILKIETQDGQVRAIVFGYACHGTTLGGDYNLLGGDWPGYTQKMLELSYPGSTVLFLPGCAGDADPQPRRKAEYVAEHGLEMAGAVAAALSRGLTPVRGPVHAGLEKAILEQAATPSREEYEKRLNDKDVFVQKQARKYLDQLIRGEKFVTSYEDPVQVWKFGNDLTLVALGGEVVVDYALRLKRELGADKLWVAAYSNDVFAYVPSVRILLEGGYEADYSMLFYDFPTRWSTTIEDTIIKTARQLIDKTSQ